MISVLSFLTNIGILSASICNHTHIRYVEPYGYGIFANNDFAIGDTIENPLVIGIEQKMIMKTILFDYTYQRRRSYSDVVLGNVMLYNSILTDNAGFYFYNSSYHVEAERDVKAGEEIFVYYKSKWFQKRGKAESFKPGTPISILPGCVYDYTKRIGIYVVANKEIPSGEIIEVSRALIIPGIRTLNTNLEAFVWYREQSNLGSVLLLGHGALYAPASDPTSANVDYQWYHDKDRGSEELSCEEVMLMSFTASRDIMEGELLTVPLLAEPLEEDSLYSRRRVIDSVLSMHCF